VRCREEKREGNCEERRRNEKGREKLREERREYEERNREKRRRWCRTRERERERNCAPLLVPSKITRREGRGREGEERRR
jgi:hypothetical protein